MIKPGLIILFALALVIALTLVTDTVVRSNAKKWASRRPVDHNEWVDRSLQEMETIKAGNTRRDLLMVFREEGGLSTRHNRTYGYRECPMFKVDVEFEAAGTPPRDAKGRVTFESLDDVITKISRPYIARPISD